MKEPVSMSIQILFCYFDCIGRVDTMQKTDLRSNERSPTTTAASQIKADCAFRQRLPRKNRKVTFPNFIMLYFIRDQAALVQTAPFVTEAFDSGRVNIFYYQDKKLISLAVVVLSLLASSLHHAVSRNSTPHML